MRTSIQSAKTRLRVDCGSDHELLTANFRIKLKKVGKTTKQFWYDINQIPYDTQWKWQIQGIRSDGMPEELWTEICNIVQETVIKVIPKEKNYKKAKWLSEEALQIAEKRREVQGKGEKGRCTYLNAEFQRIARRD